MPRILLKKSRSFLSLALLCVSMQPFGLQAYGLEGAFRSIACPSSDSNLRNSEADLIVLQDGSLFLAWTKFVGREDHDTAVIAAKRSLDNGKTWGEEFVLQDNIGKQNVMSVSLLRMKSGAIAFFFLVKNADDDLQIYMRISRDETKTWSKPKAVTHQSGYHIMNNARALRLASGRILLPIALTPDIGKQGSEQVCVAVASDDEGQTWKRSGNSVSVGATPAMEPGLVELNDGSVWMIIRTALDRIYQAKSVDGGTAWSEASPTDLVAPAAPATVSRIPATGDLLMVWNNNPLGNRAGWGGRNPLTTAISRDDGKTWEHVQNIEDDPHSGYGYTSVTWKEDRVLLTYYHWKDKHPNFQYTDLIFHSIPVSSLYAN